MGQRRRLVVMVVVAALLVPMVLDRDDFPLSTYPMYANSRGAVVSIVTATGVDAAGDPVTLSLAEIGNSDDPLIVQSLLRQAVRDGPSQTDALCSRIADRAAAGGSAQISIVTETHNVVDHAAGRPSRIERQVHTSCPVRP